MSELTATEQLARAIVGFSNSTSESDAGTHIVGQLDAIVGGIESRFLLIPHRDLPPAFKSDHGNGYVAACAQEFYQPALAYSPVNGDTPGQWNRNIAYANLAVALAVEARERVAKSAEAKISARRDELAIEFGCSQLGYKDTFESTQRAIDRIIELEEAAK